MTLMDIDKDDLKREMISWAKTVVFAVVFALCITQFVIVNAKVPTGSMMDTIQINDRIVAFRMAYLRSDPQRFDVVVFYNPDDRRVLYVKRIIGLPGETLNIREGKVYVNDSTEPLNDSFVRETPFDEDFGPYEVPDGHYFMMGDNRNTSLDARFWHNKYVPKEDILGKVLFRYFPSIKSLINI